MAEKASYHWCSETYRLEKPFWYWHQNPLEQEEPRPCLKYKWIGLCLRLSVDHPEKSDELEILNPMSHYTTPTISPVISKEELMRASDLSGSDLCGRKN